MKTNIAITQKEGNVISAILNIDLLIEKSKLIQLWEEAPNKKENESEDSWKKTVLASDVKLALLLATEKKWIAYEIRQRKIGDKYVNKLKTIHL